ncbi:hypothetical protein SGCZBJ_02975 [Caulobacter zeae]|uniref:Uncharacterized protein n=1 Tax=Caulobacter zeae TaxID=2055137 RepID=A0A2N5DQY0_9CAUL|nr:hypothetical protein [Caulobacter zeae]PLR28425.1 hypothetical protein SGCZBJ_02975 [Caulobacter zeae]
MLSKPAWRELWPLVLVSATAAGCASVDTSHVVVGRYFGMVEVRAEPPAGEDGQTIGRTKVRTLGGWVDLSPRGGRLESLGAGWRSSARLAIPADCRLVVVVRTDAQLASVKALLDADLVSKGERCAVKEED